MKSRGYEWDFDSFADKYSSLSIDDMASLYVGQNWKAQVQQTTQSAPQAETTDNNIWAKSVIAWANPTTEVGGKKINEMNTDELLKFARTQSWYKN
jgi:hypothetical protein